MTEHDHSNRTEDEGTDYLFIAIGVAVIMTLILLAVGGHHFVSLGVQP